ncbi:hypothetical protein [Bernardetia sp.]|uniref:hypothetical protein n=1 Tax=Bernardetia sp. TaxID=1937974 RepID=UPI0025C6B221|nr:hypothetical protein [Bernardetia sp.]
MKRTKQNIAISLWMLLSLFWGCYYSFYSLRHSEQKQAITITQQKTKELSQKLHIQKAKRINIDIKKHGNNPRDRQLYNQITMAYSDVKKLYANAPISIDNLKPFLSDSVALYLHLETKPLEDIDNQIIEDIYQHNLYQRVQGLLYKEYSRLYGIHCGFNNVFLMTSSDTTLGFYGLDVSDYVEIPKRDITILNQKYREDIEGVLFFKNNINKPVIFQVDTHTDDGVISKKYKVKAKKHLQPFDYEEIK